MGENLVLWMLAAMEVVAIGAMLVSVRKRYRQRQRSRTVSPGIDHRHTRYPGMHST